MDDMTAFERQVERRVRRFVGPARPVDDLAIFEAAAASRSPRWGFTMFSAVKFVTAAVIVALFGGFLLAGILTMPDGDEVAPAAVTGSPSPMTTEELLSGMVTEEVEPGVFRVTNDGVRDIAYPLAFWGLTGFDVDVTPDGSVWLSVASGGSGLYRLGEEPVFEDVSAVPREVAPDGSLWAIRSDDPGGIVSFDGEGWTVRATPSDSPTALAIGPDGTVWVAAEVYEYCPDSEEDLCSSTVLLRLEDDGSLTTIEDWADVYDGDADWDRLAVSPDGDVWLVGNQRERPQGAEVLLRFDGEGWEAIPAPEAWDPDWGPIPVDFGPDDALWMKADRVGGLARFDDPGWTMFTEADPLTQWRDESDWCTDRLEVAADGSVWLNGNPAGGCYGGVTHYHDGTWTPYLVGYPVHDLAIAPDGSVWLGAVSDSSEPAGLYVITPEAVAATE